jgi:hypothetical protein
MNLEVLCARMCAPQDAQQMQSKAQELMRLSRIKLPSALGQVRARRAANEN